jgi:hypothetical protein
MTLGHAERQRLAQAALEQRAGPAAGAAAVAAATQRLYDDLARVAVPLIGQVGVDALTGRALYLAQQQFAWLAQTREPIQWTGALGQIVFGLERQEPAVAREAGAAMFAILTELLVTFVGEPLTAGLLRTAWPEAFTDAPTEET